MSDEAALVSSTDKGRTRCILNRPQALNALTPEMLFTLAERVTAAGNDPAVDAVSLEGAGEKAFSAGFDVKVLAELGPEAHRGEPLDKAAEALAGCPKTTIALIRGHCLGAGFELAISCDFRIATIGSHFSVPAIRLGTFYRPRAIEGFLRVLGPSVTKSLFVAGRDFSAEEALRVGIIEELVPLENLEQAAVSWTTIPDQGVKAAQAHKQIIDALGATADRSPSFWAPFDQLREDSVMSSERAGSVESFAKRKKGDG
jgi:enoyl-CoA hydratase/carnithine racemase